MEVRLATVDDADAHPGDLQPRGDLLDRDVRPRPAEPRGAAGVAGRSVRRPRRDRRRATTARSCGFASLSPWRDRPAYATTVEDSVYVHREHQGAGVGRLAPRPSSSPPRPDTGSTPAWRASSAGTRRRSASTRRCGFEVVGTEREVGRKFGRWLDVVADGAPPHVTDSFPRQQARTQRFTLGAPRNLTVAPDGSRVAFLRVGRARRTR